MNFSFLPLNSKRYLWLNLRKKEATNKCDQGTLEEEEKGLFTVCSLLRELCVLKTLI